MTPTEPNLDTKILNGSGATSSVGIRSSVPPKVLSNIRYKLSAFAEVWVIDFEFISPQGQNPDVVCMVAREIFSGREIRLWRGDLYSLNEAPWGIGDNNLRNL